MTDRDAAYKELRSAEFELGSALEDFRIANDRLEETELRVNHAIEREEAARKAYEAFPYEALTHTTGDRGDG